VVERIKPSELDAEELWQRNGEYVAAEHYDDLAKRIATAASLARHLCDDDFKQWYVETYTQLLDVLDTSKPLQDEI